MSEITDKKFFSKGKRGMTYTATLGKRKVILKEKNPQSSVDTIDNEAKILKKINEKKLGPELIMKTESGIVMEFIQGPEFIEWAKNTDEKNIIEALVNILEQCRTLDSMGISKKEMTRPYKHILMKKDKPVQIDFERAIESDKPKNVTQFCQWIISGRFSNELESKNLSFSKEKIRSLAKKYKKDYSNRSFNDIVEEVRNAY